MAGRNWKASDLHWIERKNGSLMADFKITFSLTQEEFDLVKTIAASKDIPQRTFLELAMDRGLQIEIEDFVDESEYDEGKKTE